jgi:hypothetical protein
MAVTILVLHTETGGSLWAIPLFRPKHHDLIFL